MHTHNYIYSYAGNAHDTVIHALACMNACVYSMCIILYMYVCADGLGRWVCVYMCVHAHVCVCMHHIIICIAIMCMCIYV